MENGNNINNLILKKLIKCKFFKYEPYKRPVAVQFYGSNLKLKVLFKNSISLFKNSIF